MKRWFRRPRGRRGRPSTPLLALGLLVGLGSLWLMAWNTHRIQVLEAEAVRLRAERRAPVQADGDPAGTTPVDFRIAGRRLTVIVPR